MNFYCWCVEGIINFDTRCTTFTFYTFILITSLYIVYDAKLAFLNSRLCSLHDFWTFLQRENFRLYSSWRQIGFVTMQTCSQVCFLLDTKRPTSSTFRLNPCCCISLRYSYSPLLTFNTVQHFLCSKVWIKHCFKFVGRFHFRVSNLSKIWSCQNWLSLFKPNWILALSPCWQFVLLYFLFTNGPGRYMFIHHVFKTIRRNIVAVSEGNGIFILSCNFWTRIVSSWAFLFNVMEKKKWTRWQTVLQFTTKFFLSFQGLDFTVVVPFDQILWFWRACEYFSFQIWFFWSALGRAVSWRHFDFVVQSRPTSEMCRLEVLGFVVNLSWKNLWWQKELLWRDYTFLCLVIQVWWGKYRQCTEHHK